MATNLLDEIAVIIDRLDAAGELVCAAQLQMVFDNLEKRGAADRLSPKALQKVTPLKGG